MPPVEFRYRREAARGETVFRPVARVLLERDGKKVLLYPYIDSGADVTLILRSVGEVFGLTLGKAAVEELAGIGEGKAAAVFDRFAVLFREWERRVIFTPRSDDH